ncbi:DMT superfamily efflux pump, RarD [Moraxella macacae 0408225]|uniref:DMT superfamily efflux pump, RarD n=2 Tax=Moraxella macacae TaxID=765840 RepID=L2F867_9GAMM|nr:DMT superfamily efflux pump, RarD [Moraxella macacae 0408225]
MITTTPKGIATALSAFMIWGFFPLYFKLLKTYDSVEIIGHRIIWTFVVILAILIITRQWAWLTIIHKQPKWLFFTAISGAIISLNWLVYVWSVNHDRILEASLGYYIGPLVGVLLSLVVLKEKLRPLQWLAVGLATIGVLIQLIMLGKLPWVSLGVAFSFSIYGIMHRYNPLKALNAMFIETGMLVPVFIAWFMMHDVASSKANFWVSSDILLLMFAGPITLIPLLMYNKATKMVAFNLLSFLNYLTPSIIFFMAIFLYHEPFDVSKLITFAFIWTGLVFFSYDLFKNRKN